MERFNTCDLKLKEVINVCDGSKLGCPSDFEFDRCDGRILAMVIPRSCGFLGLRRGEDLIISWNKIECIGDDTILVRLSANECRQWNDPKKKKNKGFKL